MSGDWIKWSGGKCPVKDGSLVDIKYHDGHIQYGMVVGGFHHGYKYGIASWEMRYKNASIVAYRHSCDDVLSKIQGFNKSPDSATKIEVSKCNCDGCTYGDDYWDVVKLICDVTPDLAVKEVRIIATKLIDSGYGKIK